MPGPLQGLRVLDIATIIAARRPPRCWPTTAPMWSSSSCRARATGRAASRRTRTARRCGGRSPTAASASSTLDMRKPAGASPAASPAAALRRAGGKLPPRHAGRLGPGASDVLWQASRALVILRATGFGQTGPYRHRPGFARVFEAMGGLTHVTGEPDGEPMHSGYPLADNVGGLFGALGVMAALCASARAMESPRRRGEEIDLSLTEATLKLLEFLPIEHDQLGTVRQRSGNANQYSAPRRCTDARRALGDAGRQHQRAVCQQLPRHRPARTGRRPALCQQRHPRAACRRAQRHVRPGAPSARWPRCWLRFDAAQGTIAPIYGIDQIAADPQMQARQAICDVPDADFGSVRMANVVPRFAHDPGAIGHSGGAWAPTTRLLPKTSWA
jgi:crotonobetainyl-CoA:carnitine CoA-transferase CaiB-like acyl-CoA transferase